MALALILLLCAALFPKAWFFLLCGLVPLFFVANSAIKSTQDEVVSAVSADQKFKISTRTAWWGIFAAGAVYTFAALYPIATLNTWWWTVSSGFFWKCHFLVYLCVVALLAIFCSLFTFGLAFFLYIRKLHRSPYISIILLPIIWEFAEIIRVKILYGLDWGIYGHALGENIFLARTVAFGGTFVLSSIAIITNFCLFLLIKNIFGARARLRFFGIFWPTLAITLLFTGVFVNNKMVLVRANTSAVSAGKSQSLRVAVIGSKIKTDDMGDQNSADQIFKLIDVATAKNKNIQTQTQLVLTPENIFPFLVIDETTLKPVDYEKNMQAKQNFDHLVKISNTFPKISLIFGLHTEKSDTGPRSGTKNRFNSAVVFEAGKITGIYHKQSLLPFTEQSFSALKQIHIEPLSVGTGEKTLKTQHGIFTALICSEVSVIPDEKDGFFGKFVKNGSTEGQKEPAVATAPAALLNLANDMVFDSPRLAEHDRISARLQAIERGEPLIRASKGGFSGIFDATGNEVRPSSTETTQVGEILFVEL